MRVIKIHHVETSKVEVIVIDADGIRYEVRTDTDRLIWQEWVPFGLSKANRAGGAAFIQAANEQLRIAESF